MSDQSPRRALELLAGMYDTTTFLPFVEDENANITGPGHQNIRRFAEAVREWEATTGGFAPYHRDVEDVEQEIANLEEVIEHGWAVPTWFPGDEFSLKLVAPDTEGAIPITYIWGVR